ncbi:MAG: preprotein translocase subunit SecE [Candidatus Levybacteria bacterium]|nr:preprotein translocase subunit SecE [Candidatus Levybacteria bacterium]
MVSPLAFLKQTQEELRQVKWPGRDDVVRLTSIVIIVSVIVGLYIGGLDFVFTKTVEMILK